MLKKKYLKSKTACKVTFSLEKQAVNGAKEVRILGDFNNWEWSEGIPMKSDGDHFVATVELPAGRPYEFRYFTDQNTWENDWSADAYVTTPFGVDNSVVILETVTLSTKKASAKKAAPKKVTAKKTPAKKKASTKVAKDDLKKIEGIGPKIAGLLKEAGIVTYRDLADAQITQLKDILDAAGSRYKMHDPTTWMEQAALAADSQWDKLDKLKVELKGGRRKK